MGCCDNETPFKLEIIFIHIHGRYIEYVCPILGNYSRSLQEYIAECIHLELYFVHLECCASIINVTKDEIIFNRLCSKAETLYRQIY